MKVNVSLSGLEAKGNAIVERALCWWDCNRRELPWRSSPGETPDAYRVWLSEVLLQQTTARAATPFFQAFVEKWPTVEDLATPLELADIEDTFSWSLARPVPLARRAS